MKVHVQPKTDLESWSKHRSSVHILGNLGYKIIFGLSSLSSSESKVDEVEVNL